MRSSRRKVLKYFYVLDFSSGLENLTEASSNTNSKGIRNRFQDVFGCIRDVFGKVLNTVRNDKKEQSNSGQF